jgi:hypothetical protein
LEAAFSTNKTGETVMYKMLKDMTNEEVGALVKASHKGKVIEVGYGVGTDAENWHWVTEPTWMPKTYYRVKPEPTIETVTLFGKAAGGEWSFGSGTPWRNDTHKITLTIRDGVVDEAAKVEKL